MESVLVLVLLVHELAPVLAQDLVPLTQESVSSAPEWALARAGGDDREHVQPLELGQEPRPHELTAVTTAVGEQRQRLRSTAPESHVRQEGPRPTSLTQQQQALAAAGPAARRRSGRR